MRPSELPSAPQLPSSIPGRVCVCVRVCLSVSVGMPDEHSLFLQSGIQIEACQGKAVVCVYVARVRLQHIE
jgi:hypothetical protein